MQASLSEIGEVIILVINKLLRITPVTLSVYAGILEAGELRLPRPEASDSYEMVERSPQALGFFDKYMILLLQNQSTVVQIPLASNDSKLARPERALTASKRLKISSSYRSTDWVAALSAAKHRFLVDGENLAVTSVSESWEAIRGDGIIWDLLKPAADPRGEPPRWEIASVRAHVSKLIAGKTGRKLSGVVPMPRGWQGNREASFLMATNLQGHPIMTMDCDDDIGVTCKIVRTCNVQDALPSEDVRGIAAVPGKRVFVLGDGKRNALTLFNYTSCYHITRGPTIFLPTSFKKLGSFGISATGELWVVTTAPDDFTNGSLHFWPQSVWENLTAKGLDPKK
jgi:hypothetical protein